MSTLVQFTPLKTLTPVALVIDREHTQAGAPHAWSTIILHHDGTIHQKYDMPDYQSALEEAQPYLARNPQVGWLIGQCIAADPSVCNLFHHFGSFVHFDIKSDIPKKTYQGVSNRLLMRYRGCHNPEYAALMVTILNATLSAKWDHAVRREAGDTVPSAVVREDSSVLMLDHFRTTPRPHR